ncbi:uncharacterized protein BDZ99DRAFT_514629 [Mytilinidion resinicola]|uniref:Uncharacterized protein n=1 Tax=Mytilinidion resinicola TaxID=574789 RepID=A0A6A6Z4D8_9PEZI|nr:uncharacterized protein BDZ99DRAFT_514629 [Mytilinidion resinicola]KAF2816011.1 hypothetical protein BDZ99DRAFT_514629 [Mytilinidion resinicola]
MAYQPKKPSTLRVVTEQTDTEMTDVPDGASSPTWSELGSPDIFRSMPQHEFAGYMWEHHGLVMHSPQPDTSTIEKTSHLNKGNANIASSTSRDLRQVSSGSGSATASSPTSIDTPSLAAASTRTASGAAVKSAGSSSTADSPSSADKHDRTTELVEELPTEIKGRDLQEMLQDILHPRINAFAPHKTVTRGGTHSLSRIWFTRKHPEHFTIYGALHSKSGVRDFQQKEHVIPTPYWSWLRSKGDPPQLEMPPSIKGHVKFTGNIDKCRTNIKSSSSETHTMFELDPNSYTTQSITSDDIVLPSPIASPYTLPPNLINIPTPIRTPGISAKFGLILSLEDGPDAPNIVSVLREPPLGAFIVVAGDKSSGEMSRDWLLEQSPTHFVRGQDGNIIMKRGGDLHCYAHSGGGIWKKMQISEDYWNWLVNGPTPKRPHVPILHESSLRQCLMTTTPAASFRASRPTVQYEPTVSALELHKTPMFRMGPPLEIRELIDHLHYPRDARGKSAFHESGRLSRKWLLFIFPKFFIKGKDLGVKATVALRRFSAQDLKMDDTYYGWIHNTPLRQQDYFAGTTNKFPTKQYFEYKTEQKSQALDEMLEEVKRGLTN